MTVPAPSRRCILRTLFQAAGVVCLILPGSPAAAQQSLASSAGPALATREYLQATLQRLSGTRGSPAEAALIAGRLAHGDFRPGDRILVRVDGERELSDTFTVGPGPALELPRIGAVPLDGLLRAELQAQVATAIARYVKNPVVHAQSFIRLLVEGEVGKPGFYPVPPDLPLVDVVGVAGGLTQRAKARGMSVQRGSEEVWGGTALEQALARGMSLDQLSLQAGDRLFVPTRTGTGWILGTLIGVTGLIFTLTQIF